MMKINTISSTKVKYPQRLRDIAKPPSTLYTCGTLPEYGLGIAIVGTRKPTAYGRHITSELAEKLAERGAVIISGLAHGVDGIAHQGALKVGGTTIAVLAGGLDTIYPRAHDALGRQIVDSGGALVSESPPGVPPMQFRFLERNRLVSALSDILIITEAGLRSGTINTVASALEQGKDVYVVPGPITSPMSAGCNALIAQGAMPIVNIDTFIEHIFPQPSNKQISLLAQNDQEQIILSLIASGVTDGDSLLSMSKLDPAVYSQTITMLEIRGAIRGHGANQWSL